MPFSSTATGVFPSLVNNLPLGIMQAILIQLRESSKARM